VGVLWGRRRLLEELPAYKVRPAPNTLPGRWMTGTQNHEGLAGTLAAVDYLAEIGARHGDGSQFPALSGRRRQVRQGLAAIQAYELTLTKRLLEALAERPRFKVWGITDPGRLAWRAPTIAITSAEHTADEIAEHLAERHIYVWNGNLYALELTERLGLEKRGGFVRLGMVHYNTAEEVDRLVGALDELGSRH
jgi:selenocysteine lyase/cysteine desulfurase